MEATRRELVRLTGGTLTATLLAWICADPAAAGQVTTGSRIGEEAVARIEKIVDKLRRRDDADGGGTILQDSASALALARGLLEHGNATSAHRTRLWAAASDLARQRAAARFDVTGVCADRTFEGAMHFADMAGDKALGANALSFWTVSAYNSGRLNDAEAMASAALAAVRGKTTPRVEALLHTRRGRSRAHLQDARCWADFDMAEHLLSSSPESKGGDPGWIYWFDRSEILAARASSHRDMGQPGKAETLFVEAQALFPATTVRTQALYLSRQADAQLTQGHLEEACATAGTALDLTETISSHRTTEPLLELADRLNDHSLPEARDFCERVRVVLTA